jgi:hypothetical protein
MEVFSNEIIDTCLELEKIIFSGNIDNCAKKHEILAKDYASTIYFSQPNTPISLELPELQKYE